MSILEKVDTLFLRDGEGKLLPQKLVLELLEDKPEIKAIPMTKGELQKLRVDADTEGETSKVQDNNLILKYCVEPKYTEEEVKFLKPLISNAIVTAILSLSTGIEQSKYAKLSKMTAIDKAMELANKKKI